MSALPVRIRNATERDQAAITTLVHSERLNPFNLDWRNFVVATDRSGIVGAVQLRRHFDGSRELGSLVVRKTARQFGVAARLIDTLLATEAGRVFMITGARFAAHYRRWGFRRIAPHEAPMPIRGNYWFGRLAGVPKILAGLAPKKLVVLHRSERATAGRLSAAVTGAI
jgi:amino-acid N-acetyltransferase